MLGANAEADQAGRKAPQNRPAAQQTQGRGSRSGVEHAADDPVPQEDLESLRRARRKFAASLRVVQRVLTDRPLPQAWGQNIGCRDGVLDRQI